MLALVHWCRGNPGAARRTTVGKVSAGTGASPASTEERLLLSPSTEIREPSRAQRRLLQLLLLFPVGRDSTPPTSSRWFILEPPRKDLWGGFWTFLISRTFNGPPCNTAHQTSSDGFIMEPSEDRPFLRRKHITLGGLWHIAWTLATASEWGP